MACIVQPCSAYNCLFTSGWSGVPDLFKLLSSTCPWSIEISYWFVGLFLQSTRSLEYLLFVLLYSCSNRSLFWCATVLYLTLCSEIHLLTIQAVAQWMAKFLLLPPMVVLSVHRTLQATSRGLCFSSRDLRFEGKRTITQLLCIFVLVLQNMLPY